MGILRISKQDWTALLQGLLIPLLAGTGMLAGCDNFDQTNCLGVGEQLRDFEARTGETVPLSLYDPTWFVGSSECWQTTIERAAQCGAQCEDFAEQLSEIEYQYYLENSDAGIVDVGIDGGS